MLHLLFQISSAALVNAALASLVIIALASAVMHFRGWSAATRYVAWWLALGLVILLPFAFLSQPFVKQSSAAPHEKAPTVHVKAPAGVAASLSLQKASFNWGSLLDLAGVLCGCAISVKLMCVVYGLFAAMRLKRHSQPCADSRLLELSTRLRLRRRVLLAVSDSARSPLTIGYVHPVIVLPKNLHSQLERQETGQVLLHELAHIARYDDWAILLQRFIGALFVFHPLVQWICWRMDLDRELACDDRVLDSSQAAAYAACLTKIAELISFDSPNAVMVTLLARKSILATRIEAMLDTTRSHAAVVSPGRAFTFAALGVLIAVAGLRVPALVASPLAEQSTDQLGPIVLISPDGSASTFEADGSEFRKDSAFPHGTIVFKSNGHSYIIRDRSTVAAANKLLQPMTERSRQQEELGAKQQTLGAAQQMLGERMQLLTDTKLDAATTKAIEAHIREMEEKLRSFDAKTLTSAADAQARVADLQSQLAEVQAQLGEAQEKIGSAQGKLGEEQGVLGEQQGRLGELQGKLGEQQAQDAKRMERELKVLVERAKKQGLAQPLQ